MTNFGDKKTLILLEVNEVNFDLVNEYIQNSPGKYPALEKLINGLSIRTTSEETYKELEPWIQWVSVHTGLSYADHRVFRLGDIVGSGVSQIFEILERRGLIVGSVSPMNAENQLIKPAYFIPDPWTKTRSDGSFWSELLAQTLRQAVNDNAQSKITTKSALMLLLAFIRFAKWHRYGMYIKLALKSRRASWRKALFLDLLLHDVHLGLFSSHKPHFSTVFLNAAAHIQHHFFFNSFLIKKKISLRNPTWYTPDPEDPFVDMLTVYDTIVCEYLMLKGVEVIVVSGLSQIPYDRIKYYYRLRDHASFLDRIGIQYRNVMPRMTRDFLVEFDSIDDAVVAEDKLRKIRVESNGERFFAEVDNRGDSLFVTLTYPHEINEETTILVEGLRLKVKPHTIFVAIKNGMHQAQGFAFFTKRVGEFAPIDLSHVKEIFKSVVGYFGLEK